jgi:transcriptional regulator with XRE-family HTH domain
MVIEWFVGPGENDNEAFGKWLRESRHRAGLTRAEAANKLDFTMEYIRLVEQGKRIPASDSMDRVFTAYEVVYEKIESNLWRVDNRTIMFTSSALEARQPDEADIPTEINRHETLGWIVDHLNQIENLTLIQIQKLLKRDLGV